MAVRAPEHDRARLQLDRQHDDPPAWLADALTEVVVTAVLVRHDRAVGFSFRKSIRLGRGARLNVSKRGVSMSQRIGRLTLNSRGGGSIRILPGLSFRFGKRR
jgi:hypothetical protein